jgi:hypothetical protein
MIPSRKTSGICLIVLSLFWGAQVGGAAGVGSVRPLLADPAFAEGFGAAFIYGSEFSGSRRPTTGKVTAYRDIAPWQVHLIPEGPVKKVGVKTHPWDFQEGYHENYTNPRGEKVRELHAHRLVVNHKIEANTLEKLQFAQFNNDGLTASRPVRREEVRWLKKTNFLSVQ